MQKDASCRKWRDNTTKYLSDLFDLDGAVEVTKNMTVRDYGRITRGILQAYENVDAVVEDNNNPRGNFVGCLLRLEGHDFMDFRSDKKNGGADACINLLEDDNKGLE